ncbi:MAG TPA: PilZ domain-containing protein [Bryobacteraceae bacterium]|nr:PilZ domain-containing protein [Bryobacteraceae bacterium]
MPEASERRAEPRVEFAGPCLLSRLSDNDPPQPGTISNASEHGASVSVKAALPLGDLVSLEVGDDLFVATVAHCEAGSDGHSIGLELLSGTARPKLRADLTYFTVTSPGISLAS